MDSYVHEKLEDWNLPGLIAQFKGKFIFEAILQLSPEGKAILHAYAQCGELSSKNQTRLAGAVISSEINDSDDYIISSQRLIQLAHSITIVFPSEKAETYYIPYKLNKITKKRVLAKGKLYDKYCKYRALLRQSGAIVSELNQRTGCQTLARPVILAFRTNFDQDEAEKQEEIQEHVQWLKNCIQPWPNVEQFWKTTSRFRINQLISSDEVSSVEYLSTYRPLSQPLGYNLLNIDFTSMYPDKTLQLFTQWPRFVDEILNYCRRSVNVSKQIKKLVVEIDDNAKNTAESEHVDTIPSDATTLIILRLIPLLLPCPSIRIPKKLPWRPSRIESQNGFFLHVPSASHLETELTSRKDKLAVCGLTEQPLPVAVGESITKIDSWYVCINNLRYKVNSPLEAVDVAFKSFYALQLQYPKEAETSWMVIQARIYELSEEIDSVVPSVVTLLANMKR